MKSQISSKGQITVPVAVRRALGLDPGSPVRFDLVEAGALLRKGAPGAHPVDTVYGTVRLRGPVDALVEEMRGPRPRPRRSGTKR